MLFEKAPSPSISYRSPYTVSCCDGWVSNSIVHRHHCYYFFFMRHTGLKICPSAGSVNDVFRTQYILRKLNYAMQVWLRGIEYGKWWRNQEDSSRTRSLARKITKDDDFVPKELERRMKQQKGMASLILLLSHFVSHTIGQPVETCSGQRTRFPAPSTGRW